MRNSCEDCMGIDNAKGYLAYVQSKYHDIKFKQVDKLYTFNLKRKFDLVSCNRDVVNMFTNFDYWKTFFKTVYEHLNKNGLFLFDFYTQKKLENWQGIIYEEGDDLDYVSKVSQNNGCCVQNEVYYLKETSTLYRKTGDIMVEAWFKTDVIIDALKEAGFKSVKMVDIELNEIKDTSDLNRIHILATR